MLRSVKNGGAGGNRTLVLLRSLARLPSNRNQISPIMKRTLRGLDRAVWWLALPVGSPPPGSDIISRLWAAGRTCGMSPRRIQIVKDRVAASGASHLRGGEVGQPVGIGPALMGGVSASLMLPIIHILRGRQVGIRSFSHVFSNRHKCLSLKGLRRSGPPRRP